MYLRVSVAMELITHQQLYDVSADDGSGQWNLRHSMQSLLNASLTPGAYAELAHIYALSADLGVVIESYMPSVTSAGLCESIQPHCCRTCSAQHSVAAFLRNVDDDVCSTAPSRLPPKPLCVFIATVFSERRYRHRGRGRRNNSASATADRERGRT